MSQVTHLATQNKKFLLFEITDFVLNLLPSPLTYLKYKGQVSATLKHNYQALYLTPPQIPY